MMVHTFTTIATFTAQGLIVNQYAFLFLRILTALFSVIGFLSALTYGVEILGPSRRSLPSTILCFMFAGGFAGISILSYYLPDWQNLTLGIAALAAVNILFHPFCRSRHDFLSQKA